MLRRVLPALLLCAGLVQADWVDLQPASSGIRLLSNQNVIQLSCSVSGFETEAVDVNGQQMFQIRVPGAPISLEAGAPELPHFASSIVLPDQGDYKLEIVGGEYRDFDLQVAPSKGNLKRNIDPAMVPFELGAAYQQPVWPAERGFLRDPYILRDFRGQTLVCSPFQYLPEKGVLRVWQELELELHPIATAGINTIDRPAWPSRLDETFAKIYERQFINWGSDLLYNPMSEQGSMLIICADEFISDMADFVEWKRQSGIEVDLQALSAVGSTYTAIGNYVDSYYSSPGLTWLLLVGDADQMPTPTSFGGSSDPTYAKIVGSDNYPDILVGRFSATTSAQVQTQVLRSIEYERDASAADWYHHGLGVASNQGPGDDGEYDNVHMNNIRADLMGYTYDLVDQVYDPSGSASQVATSVNAGRSVINYTGHGSTTAWGSSGFSVSNINALTNDNMLPFIFDVACVNGQFDGYTCFAEAWMRATNGSEPTGAIGIYASSINQDWNPPMAAQDECNDLLVAEDCWTYGALCYQGSMLMMDEYGSDGYDMYDTWHVFGDPSVHVRTDSPLTMAVSHPASILNTASQLNLATGGVENALATLYYDGEILGQGTSDASGNCMVSIADDLPVGVDLTLTVLARNCVTYQGLVSTIPPEGAYVSVSQTVVAEGGALVNAATLNLDVELSNLGVETASAVTAVLSCEDPYVTVLQNSNTWGTIPAEGSVTLSDAFEISTAMGLPDGHNVQFEVLAASGGEEWESSFSLIAHAPVVEISSVTVLDSGGNGRLDPGETATLQIGLSNMGSQLANAFDALLSCGNADVSISADTDQLAALAAGASAVAEYSISVDAGASVGSVAWFNLDFDGSNLLADDVFDLTLGLILEDFESGDFSGYEWVQGGTADWQINSSAYEGSWCAKSGTISHSSSSEMSVTMDVSGDDVITFWYKVSSESGYDYLRFLVDGSQEGAWAGEVDWTEAEFDITEGTHTFTWRYYKDGSVSNGSDCAWVDYIVFPAGQPPAAPTMDVSPASIELSLMAGTSDTRDLIIGNSGTGELNWELSLVQDARQRHQNPSYKVDKSGYDPRPGTPGRPSGGPDDFGYSWIDSSEDGGPSYQWIDISSTGTAFTGTADDWNSGMIAMGIDFPFYGNVYDELSVCSNGWLSFTSTSTEYGNDPIPGTDEPHNLIVPFWDDLNPTLGDGEIYYLADTANERFIVQWQDVHHWGSENLHTFQVILNADGSILFQYETLQQLGSVTIGIENSDASVGLQILNNAEGYPSEGLAIEIVCDPQAQWLSATPQSGTTAVGGSSTVVVGFTAEELEPGDYTGSLTVSGNDPQNLSQQVPVTLHVLQAALDAPELQIVSSLYGLRLEWTAVEGASSYRVMEAEQGWGPWMELAHTSVPYLELNRAETGTVRAYRVIAIR